MILQVQGFFKDMNAQCNVVLHMKTIFSFGIISEISANVIVKNCYSYYRETNAYGRD